MRSSLVRLALAVTAVGLALLVGWLAVPLATGAGEGKEPKRGGVPHPQIVVPKEGQCVRPTEWMRRNHMDLLQHHKVDAVRKGVRVKKESLDNCRTCHTKRGEFCDRCHAYTAVKMDCFDCHNYPK